ncbi:SGNH/GDSL hydrolase family protein [Paenibacillus sp. EKM212P]|uniref:SGNH/GDSL hydrolase family protein n=1 Tax=Paenibacillus sp. EKM212P TaxID=1683680 RepID=UPI0013EDCFB3|nr:SGNH/GDSL hydrolase family protein [Paenibacillus sp. EKM212P]KAF6578294.1 SGNH/GDSL hydrolase family protein [Paenibacillus sp. EKM212P]
MTQASELIAQQNATPTVVENSLFPPIFNDLTGVSPSIYGRAISDYSTVPYGSLDRAHKAIVQTATLKVAYWGDSITEGVSDMSDPDDNYVKRVDKLIRRALPNVTVTSQNFGLGGRGINDAANPNYKAVATEPPNISGGFYRPWSVVGKSWKDHIKDFNPNLLIIAFGMNDSFSEASDANEAGYLNGILNDIESWPVKPSVVVVPTILPTNDPFKNSQTQEYTLMAARASRYVARNRGVAVADANRLFTVLRDGWDDTLRSASYNERDFAYLYTLFWEGDKFSFSFSNNQLIPNPNVTNKSLRRTRAFYNGVITMDIKFALEGDPGNEWLYYRISPTAGSMLVMIGAGATNGYVRLYSVNTSNQATWVAENASVAIPVAQYHRVVVSVHDDQHVVSVNGVEVLNAKSYDSLHAGAIQFGSVGTPPTITNLIMAYSDVIKGDPIYDELALLGKYNDFNEEGNGINHPTGLGHAMVYEAAFYGVIGKLSEAKESGMLVPTVIKAASWNNADASFGNPTAAGERLWFVFMTTQTKYNKKRGVALRRLDTGAYYKLSEVVVSKETSGQLAPGSFGYYSYNGGTDILLISVPNNGTVTWDTELYRYSD